MLELEVLPALTKSNKPVKMASEDEEKNILRAIKVYGGLETNVHDDQEELSEHCKEEKHITLYIFNKFMLTRKTKRGKRHSADT